MNTESCACGQDSAHLDDQAPSGQPILAGNREDSASGAGSSILAEAESLVYGDRGRDYGPPVEDYGRAVAIYHAITGRHTLEDAADGIRFMLAVKLSRMAVSPDKRDHYVDLAGYTDCLWRVLQ